jgi:uncharacterized membrane protein
MKYILVCLALAGAIVSSLALHVHYSNDDQDEPCNINAHWDCGIVNHSPFAEIAHIPVAAIGIVGYLALIPMAFVHRHRFFFLASLVGLGFALYLTYIEKYILEVWCIYCVLSLGIITLNTLLSGGWLLWTRFKTK